MALYIIKSTVCLAIFFLVYKLFLENERMHLLKRFYLLLAVFASFGIPLLTFTQYIVANPIEDVQLLNTQAANSVIIDDLKVTYLPMLLWTIYGFGVLFFLVKFVFNFSTILKSINKNPKHKINRFTHVLIKELQIPHTFFNYIFLNKFKFEARQIPKEVLQHEQAHATQKHSIDILCIELIQIIFWFNPFIYIIKHAIKLNHEFLADEAVLNKGIHLSNYQNILLNYTSTHKQVSLANAINYSFIKKRFTIMKTQTSRKAIWVRSLLLLPLFTIMIYGFSEKEFVQQDKATAAEISEYNKLAKKYNEMDPSHMTIKLKEIKRLTHIYNKMTADQKKTAAVFPNIPPPPPPVEVGSEEFKVKEAPMPPPPPLPKNATAAQKKNYQKNLENYKNHIKKGKAYTYKGVNGELIEVVEDAPPPPPPPIPPNPLDHVIEMAKKGATFYYEDKKISSDKAIEIVKKNQSINIQVRDHVSKNPIVKLSKKPIVVEKN